MHVPFQFTTRPITHLRLKSPISKSLTGRLKQEVARYLSRTKSNAILGSRNPDAQRCIQPMKTVDMRKGGKLTEVNVVVRK